MKTGAPEERFAAGEAPVVTRPRRTSERRSRAAGVSARERAYRELKFRILEGRLPPGATLLEAEVADMLSLSRTPIREALIRLEEEGLVEIRPRRGIVVRLQSIEDLAEIYQVLSALEVKAAQLAARRGLPGKVSDVFRGLLDGMEQATARGDLESWSWLDDRFHSGVAAACGNSRLQSTLRLCWDQQYRARPAIVPLRPPPTDSNREHRAIFAAIEARDEAAAVRLHREHRERADSLALELLSAARGRPCARMAET